MSTTEKTTIFHKTSHYSFGKQWQWRAGWVAAFVVGIVLALALSIGTSAMWVVKTKCRNQANNMGFPYSWSVTSACMIQVEGRWVSIENYRIVQQVP